MANGTYIYCYSSMLTHPKTYSLADILNIPNYAAMGLVVALSQWACENAPDGDITRFPDRAISEAVKYDGKPKKLLDALIQSGYVDDGNGRRRIHDFYDYAGKLMESRRKRAERNKRYYEKKKGCEEVDKVKGRMEVIEWLTGDGNDMFASKDTAYAWADGLVREMSAKYGTENALSVLNGILKGFTISQLLQVRNAARSADIEDILPQDIRRALEQLCVEVMPDVPM